MPIHSILSNSPQDCLYQHGNCRTIGIQRSATYPNNGINLYHYLPAGIRSVYWRGYVNQIYFPHMILVNFCYILDTSGFETYNNTVTRVKQLCVKPNLVFASNEPFQNSTKKNFKDMGFANVSHGSLCCSEGQYRINPDEPLTQFVDNLPKIKEMIASGDKLAIKRNFVTFGLAEAAKKAIDKFWESNFNNDLGVGSGWPFDELSSNIRITKYWPLAAQELNVPEHKRLAEAQLMQWEDMTMDQIMELSSPFAAIDTEYTAGYSLASLVNSYWY